MSNWLGSGASEALVLAPWVSLQPTSMSMDSIFVHKLKGSADSMYSRCRQVGHRGGRTDQGTTCKFAVYNEAVNRTPGSHRTIADGSVRPESSWRRQYEAEERRATIVDYQPESFEQVFAARPGRIWGRFAQVFFEVCEVLSALVADQVTKEDTTPRRIRESATRLGPNFVKIGQALASRPDLVGDAVAGELLLLQDAMPIFPTEIARECIREELGSYPEQMFEGMTDTPVASASLGQVYKAQLHGMPVAVKVQRPDLFEIAGLDFYLARSIAAVIMRLSRELDHLFGARLGVRSDLVAAVDEYGSRLFEELDYRIEARNMVRFRELYGTTPGVLVPGVLLAFSGRRVITTEWVDGDKLVNSKAQVDPSDMPILRTGIDFTLTQLLEKGFLHADPHGGNLLKTSDGKLAYLDFGLVSTIPPTVMDALVCATMHIMNRDYVRLARGFPELALMSDGNLVNDFGPFAAALEDALDPVVTDFRFQLGLDRESLRSSSSSSERVAFAQLIDKVFFLARSFDFRVPPYFISNVRALGELEGLALAADPGFSLISAVYPYVCRRLLSKPSPVLREALQELVVNRDGSVRWTVLEGMIRDASILDERYGPSAENRRSPLDLALDFLVSTEGSFIRGALVSDLRHSTTRFFRRRLPNHLGFQSEGLTPSTSGICREGLRGGESHASEGQGARRSSASVSLATGDFHSAPGHEAFASLRASRRALMGQLWQGALRRPVLVLRGCAAIVASCTRAACRAVAAGVLRGRSRSSRPLRLHT